MFLFLAELLAGEDMALRHVVSVKMYVQDMGDYVQLNNQYIRHFSLNPPVRVCVEVGSSFPLAFWVASTEG